MDCLLAILNFTVSLLCLNEILLIFASVIRGQLKSDFSAGYAVTVKMKYFWFGLSYRDCLIFITIIIPTCFQMS